MKQYRESGNKRELHRAGAAALVLSAFLLFGQQACADEPVAWGTGPKRSLDQSITFEVDPAGQTIGAPKVYDGNGRALSTADTTSGITIGFIGSGDLTFDQNKATGQGGALWIVSNKPERPSALTMNIDGALTFSNNLSQKKGGGAIYLQNANAAIKAKSVTFSDNTAPNVGGAIHSAATNAAYPVTLTIEATAGDVSFISNKSTANDQMGGALYLRNGKGTISGDAVVAKSNDAKGNGGAYYLLNTQMTMKGTSIDVSNNSASQGGAYYLDNTQMTMKGTSIDVSKNSASQGGAFYLDGAELVLSGTSVTLNDNRAQDGAVIFSKNSTTRIEAADSVTLSGDKTSNGLAAIYLSENSVLRVKAGGDVVFTGNEAEKEVSVIYGEGATVDIEAGGDFRLTGNKSGPKNGKPDPQHIGGGSIYLRRESDLHIKAKNVLLDGNESVEVGAALVAQNSTVRIEAEETFSVSGNKTTGKIDDVFHGALSVQGKGWGQETLTIAAGDITVEGNRTVRGYTAGIDVIRGLTVLSADRNIRFAENTSEQQHAPAFRVQDNTELRAGGSIVFEKNTGHPQHNGGGGSAMLIGMLAIDDRKYDPYLTIQAPEVKFISNVIEQNNSDSISNDITVGGALLNRNQYMVLSIDATNVEFVDNRLYARTRAHGGAISEFMSGDVYISAKSILLKDNIAHTSADSAAEGGASYLDGSFAGQTFAPGAYGGAIYTRVGTVGLSADEVTFEGNKALSVTDAFGGAVTLVSTDEIGTPAALRITAPTKAFFTGNAVSTDSRNEQHGARGGAMYLRMGELSVDAGALVLEKNTAYAEHTNADGGAVYVGQASVNISADSVEFAENAASVGADGFSAHGGALYNGDGHIVFKAGTLNMKGNSVSAGAEANGGAITAASGDLNVTVGEAFVENNTAEAASGAARGGAAYIGGGSAVWNTNGSTKFSGNKATGAEEAAGSAIYVDGGSLTFNDGLVIFAENESSASADDAYGALTVNGGHLTIASTGTGGETQFDLNTASGVNAYGGAVALTGGNVRVESRVLGFAGNRAEASGDIALGGAIYSAGDVSFIADEGLIMKGNKAAAADGDAFGGAVYAQNDIVISVGRAQDAARAENDGGEIIGDAVFEGNEADLGGALYSEGGDITLTRQKDAGGIFDFVTDTDDVFARIGRISVTGTLIARPGVSFTGGGQFLLGDGSSLVLQGRPHGDDAKPSHFAIFGGDFEKDPAMAVNFNKARLSLTNYDELRAQAGTENRYMADIAAVMYRNDPGLIGANDVSADITGADYALDTRDYRNGRLYLHRTIAQKDAQTDRVKSELYGENAPIYKLVLAYDRHTLIWRGLDEYDGSDPKWNEGMERNFVWVSAGDQEDSYFTPKKSDDGTKYVQDSFYRGDIVVFDGKKYDSLDYGSAEPMPGRKWTVPLAASGDETGGTIGAARVYVTGGAYDFTNELGEGGGLETDRLFVLSRDTVATFKLPVTAFEEVSVGAGATASFEDLTAMVNKPVDIAGTMNVKRPDKGSYTVYGGGTLTLHDGSGLMNSLTLEDRSTLNINALGSYRVSDHFTARTGSRTVITPGGDWAANNGAIAPAALIGEGNASASIESGAKLTINGIRPNSTGKWTLLKNFQKKVDGKGWGDIGSGTLIITGSANWNGNLVKNNPADGDYLYEVKTDDEDRDYVLVITQHKEPKKPEPEKEEEQPTPPPTPPTPPNPPAPPEPEPTPGHTDTFHIAGSVQRALSRAAIEPRPDKHLWAHFWRDTGRVYDTRDDLALKTRAYGVIIGRDLNKDHKKTWGLAAHIGKGDTSGKGYWDGATSDTNFWGLMLYGRRDEKKWYLTGDASFNWFKTDYTEANGSSADNARSTMFSVGGRAYYKWIDNPQPGQMSVHPFIGARWNYYRQSGYSYDNGDVSRAWKSGQLHVPMGVKIQWGEMESKDGWHVTPTLEASYIRTIGQRSAVTGIHAPRQAGSGVRMPLSARDTFAAEFRYVTRNEKKGFHWELNAGIRRSTSEKDLHVGTTFKWEL